MQHWAFDSIFYHIYPLGLCGAPRANDFCSPAAARLEMLYDWLDHIQDLGANALYLGPLFESSTHGYDTVDYYHVDRRLGNNQTLARLSEEFHRRGLRLVLDAVFNHVGRDFWAFNDLRKQGQNSAYKDWFYNLRFGGKSPYRDPFSYEGWNGHHSLVKLNLGNPRVREHLFGAVRTWVEQFGIDGLRLDAADSIDLDFLSELTTYTKSLRADFWLMGEVVHGDYRRWVNPETLDAVTNYECYKGLYSSLNDRNYFEIAYALKRQFGENGIYRGLPLYNFADNHDVNRIASSLSNPAHLVPLYTLLLSMPGVPSIYYGSEWGIEGRRTSQDDSLLRPALKPDAFQGTQTTAYWVEKIRQLAQLRQSLPALRYGNYRELYVSHEQFAFLRESCEQRAVIIINAAADTIDLAVDIPWVDSGEMIDLLNPGDRYTIRDAKVWLTNIPPHAARILTPA